jgi:DNA-binding NarL/FixJ family response regulator
MKRNHLTVYLADDHTVVRKGMVRLLKTFQRINLVKDAANGKELIQLVESLAPHAVILDIEMPVMGGIETSKYLVNHFPEIKILILTMHTETIFIHKLMDIGVQGFLSKTAEPEEVERALYAIVDKDFYRNDIVEKAMEKKLLETKDTTSKLSGRELEVLLLICEELTPAEISERLQISEKTFFNHRSSILAKTRCRSNVGLFRFAVQRGLFKMD